MTVFVIAEIGPNHNGSLDTAVEMIRRLAETGVDAVKFQLGSPDDVYSKDAFKADYQVASESSKTPQEMTARHQLTRRDHVVLNDACRAAGVAYMCTAFDMGSLEFLDRSFDMPYFKVPSGEIHTLDMLEYIAAHNRPILLSTGMATFGDIEAAIAVLEGNGPRDVTILHCVSNYPAPAPDVHLNVIGEIRRRFGHPVGFSDHTLGNACAIAAVALGAAVIEKHVTLDRSLPGPDHKASATVEEFADLVSAIRTVEAALGGTEKVFSEAETGIRRAARKSIVAARDLKEGDVLTREDVCFKRPGTGISPLQRDSVVGRRLRNAVEAGRLIRPLDLA